MPSSFERRHAALLRVGGFQRRTYPVGQPIAPDPQRQALIAVARGRMLATVLDASGRECLCMLREVDSLLGFESFGGAPIPYALWPLSELDLWTAPKAAVGALMADPVALRSLVTMAARAYALHLEERIMLSWPAIARLAQFLLLTKEEDAAVQAGAVARVELPRHVMARVLAMRPETLSRSLKRLELDGAIGVGADIRILDATRLRAAAE